MFTVPRHASASLEPFGPKLKKNQWIVNLKITINEIYKCVSIDMILRASFLLSLCGRGKTGSVKDHSLYILSPKGGGKGVPGSLMVLLPSLLSLFRSVFYSLPPPPLDTIWIKRK